ncbi:MAG: hypothetical protein GXZ14_04380 [Ruminococcaceae bacterium]|nr:hypothetical protein [Oscillospiraceae bacterium]
MPINTFFSDDDVKAENQDNVSETFFGADDNVSASEEDIFASLDTFDMPDDGSVDIQLDTKVQSKGDIGSSIFDNLVGGTFDADPAFGADSAPAPAPSEETLQFDLNNFDAMPLFDTMTDININAAAEAVKQTVPVPAKKPAPAPKKQAETKQDDAPDIPSFMANPAKPEPPKPILFDFEKEFNEADAAADKNSAPLPANTPAPIDIVTPQPSQDELYAQPTVGQKSSSGFDFDAFERENFSDDALGVSQLDEQPKPVEAAAPAAATPQEEQPQAYEEQESGAMQSNNDAYESKRQYKPVFSGPISNPVTETKEARAKIAAAKKAAAAAALAGLEYETPAAVQPQPEQVEPAPQPQTEYGVPVLESPTDTPVTAPVTQDAVVQPTLENTDTYPAGSDNFSFTGENIGIDTSLFDSAQTQQPYTDYSAQDFFDSSATDDTTVANVAAGVADAMGVTGGYTPQPDAFATRVFDADTSATRVFDANDLNAYQPSAQPDAFTQPQSVQFGTDAFDNAGFDGAGFDAAGFDNAGFENSNFEDAVYDNGAFDGAGFNNTTYGTETFDAGFDNTAAFNNDGFENVDFNNTTFVEGDLSDIQPADYQQPYDEGVVDDAMSYQQPAQSQNPFESSDWTGEDDEGTGDIATPSARGAREYSAVDDDDDYERPRRSSRTKSKSGGGNGGKKNNLPLIILLVVLIAAIIGIVIYALTGGKGKANSTPASVSQSVVTDPSASTGDTASSVAEVPAEPAVDPIPRDAWYMVLANKDNLLSADFSVSTATTSYGGEVDSRITGAVNSMLDAAKAEGVNLLVHTGYRSYAKQQSLFSSNPTTAAPAGGSDYNTGLGIGLYVSGGDKYDDGFDSTTAGQWLAAHAAEYGFIQRYPSNGEATTGFGYMPWQYRFVGVVEAQRIKASGMTLEQYLTQENPTGVPTNENADDGSQLAAG